MSAEKLAGICVSDSFEGGFGNVLKSIKKTFIDPLVEEINIISVVFKNVTNAVFSVILRNVHDVS